MKLFFDQMNRPVEIPHWPPRRIISLVPSQTEFLSDLGLEKKIVGITKFCVHPRPIFKNTPRIGGTKQYKMDRIGELQPDLIIGNKEENEKEQIEELASRYPVWLSDILTLPDALDMMKKIGALVDAEKKATQIAGAIHASFESLGPFSTRPRVAYFIWRKPYFVAASDTFIHEMLYQAGFENIFAHLSRYPEIKLEDLSALQADYIFLSSEPFPFKEKHFEEFTSFCQPKAIRLVDGELFSWYGSRLLKSAAYFSKLRKELN